MKKKIIVFGATGGTGSQVVAQALNQGLEVTVFARNPEKLNGTKQKVHICKGDVLDVGAVSKAIKGHDAVICTLGAPAKDKTSLRELGTTNIIRGMRNHGVKRLICQTSLGYADSEEVLPWHMKYLIVPFILKNAFKDHELQESVIDKSGLDWTIVRPGNMTNGELTGKYKHGFEPTAKIKLKVSRNDVAHFMLRQVEDSKYIHKKVPQCTPEQ